MAAGVDQLRGVGGAEKPDADLIAEMHLPGGEALRALCQRYTRTVHRVAAAILHDEAEAEDVTQEVFLEIYRKSHLYDPSRGAVRVWVLQYAYSRSLRRRNTLRRRAAYGGERLDCAELATVSQRRELTRQECRWVIQAALEQLPERQRATVELACLHDASLQDVARRLHVSFGSARHYYYRGLERLRVWANHTGNSSKRGGTRPFGAANQRAGVKRARARSTPPPPPVA